MNGSTEESMNDLQIYNIYGEKIYSGVNQLISPPANLLIDLSTQPGGIYFLQLKIAGRIVNKKLIIQ